mgnify:CR=1 FL=1
MPPRVIVLGSSGMLALGIQHSLSQLGIQHEVIGRSTKPLKFDAASENAVDFGRDSLRRGDVVINCIGLTKAHINSESIHSLKSAIQVNSVFPNDLAMAAEQFGFRVIQVATDCVFSGRQGGYSEESPHDALDVYGKTKSLGESPSPNVMHLRCSLIGREAHDRNTLLYNWVSMQSQSARISGYTNHIWNGLTNQVFGNIVGGIIKGGMELAGAAHLVPANRVTKAELVQMIATKENRLDIEITPEPADASINRTLSTLNPSLNSELFALAGYSQPPSIERMISDLI